MADEPQLAGVSADQTHHEGTEHIKSKVFGENEPEEAQDVSGAAEGTAAIAAATPFGGSAAGAPVSPITPAQPPASNPGADDATAGIAKDAGGVSSAAPVQSPVSSKRKSIVGTLKGFLGFEKKEGGAATSSDAQGYIAGGAAAASSAATAAVTQATQLAESTRVAVLGESQTDGAAAAATSTDAHKGAAAADSGAAAKNETADKSGGGASKNENLPDVDTSGENTDKPPHSGANPNAMENREAIPTAGGEKLGDKHWGESKIVPEVPKPAAEEEAGVASAEGQPTEEVKDNTAKNTGAATAAPSGKAAGEGEKKEKFFDKLKGKMRGGKKQEKE